MSTERQKPATNLDAELLEIAHRHIDRIETLETRRSDSLDFHDIAVWELKSALEAAYRAGQANVWRGARRRGSPKTPRERIVDRFLPHLGAGAGIMPKNLVISNVFQMRGGPTRTRTWNQTVMSRQL